MDILFLFLLIITANITQPMGSISITSRYSLARNEWAKRSVLFCYFATLSY